MTQSKITISRAGALGSRSLLSRLARRPIRPFAGVALGALALGCSSDAVDLGGGVVSQELSSGSRCADSPIIDDNVSINDQEELNALTGCEEIRGDLDIRIFADADLTPLQDLRVVQSALLLGNSAAADLSIEDYENDELVQEIEAREAPLRGNWLSSLAGLESLESVGGLAVFDTGIVDFTPLAQLQRIGGSASRPSLAGLEAAELFLFNNPLLHDLDGLENASGAARVQLVSNVALQSLGALPLGPTLSLFNVFEAPALTDIDALSTVKNIDFLILNGSGVTSLDAFSALESADSSLDIANNAALVDASGLARLQSSRSVLFADNAALKVLPSFTSFFQVPDILIFRDNPELEELSLDFPLATTNFAEVGSESRPLNMDIVSITGNGKLRSVAFAPSLTEAFGLKGSQVVALQDNPSLTRVDFGGLTRVDLLSIANNAGLSEITLGDLATVDSLEITDNPALDASVFDPVSTFRRLSSGNAAELAP